MAAPAGDGTTQDRESTMSTRERFLAAPGLLAALALSAASLSAQRAGGAEWRDRCSDGGMSGTRHCEVRELGFVPSGPIRVDAGQVGGVQVVAWDHDSVYVQARLQAAAPSAEEAAGILRRVQVRAGPGGVRAVAPAGERGRWLVVFMLYVPRNSDLALTANHGAVSVDGVNGRIRLQTVNGPLSLARVGGDVAGHTRNGPVHVTLAGSRWEGRGLNVETLNGSVALEIPAGYSARLDAGTLNGPPLAVQYPVGPRPQGARRIATELGEGGAAVRVVTRLGTAVVRRAAGGTR
jgi:hypothetical protein